MKITPGNQTLILASEGRAQSPTSGASQAKTAAINGSVLQRVTIVASQPDSTLLYLRADYATFSDQSVNESTVYDRRSLAGSSNTGTRLASENGTPRGLLPAVQQSRGELRDDHGNALISSRDIGITSFLKPAEQYARTQRILTDTPPVQQIDVHA